MGSCCPSAGHLHCSYSAMALSLYICSVPPNAWLFTVQDGQAGAISIDLEATATGPQVV